MFNWITEPIGNLPPVQWLFELGLWDIWVFAWIGSIGEFIGNQESLRWVMDRFAGLTITFVVLGSMSLELLWFLWAWVRGAQIDYNEKRAKEWTVGPRAGQLKKKPIDLEIARTRRFAWPLLCLPLFLVAASMYIWTFVLWPGTGSLMLMPILWFGMTPFRRVWFIWVARRAFRANHGNAQLDTTLLQDVRSYFYTGIAGSPKSAEKKSARKEQFEPSFEDTGWLSRRLISLEKVFGRYGTFWRIWRVWRWLRFWEVFRLWGLLAQLVIAFFWPIAVAIAPFAYAKMAEDYEDMMNPWWRRHRDRKYKGGNLIQAAPETTE